MQVFQLWEQQRLREQNNAVATTKVVSKAPNVWVVSFPFLFPLNFNNLELRIKKNHHLRTFHF